MDTLIIFVTFNPGSYIDYLNKNINLILNNSEHTQVIVIDNSTDRAGIMELIDNYKYSKRFNYILNEVNNGPGSGFNQGIRYAITNQYKYCYLVDQDSLIDVESLESLIIFANTSNIDFSFLSSKVLCEKNLTELYYFRANFNKNMSIFFSKKKNYKEKYFKVNAAGYTGLFLDLDTIKRNNIFINEDLFIAFDDYDFTYRLSKVNEGYVVTDSYITHPNKRLKYNSYFGQFILNYLRQIPFSEDFRKLKSSRNYMYLIDEYGSQKSKFIKLNLIIYLFKYIDRDVYNRADNLKKTVTLMRSINI
ncbi:glycosyltransferase [Paenibacillus sp. FSL R5-0887]|uniref:glycosyltransferase n=1 Tax=Paenibacillus sp. FSL R5-0887 TaxID=2921662 RepID=UPI0030F5627C